MAEFDLNQALISLGTATVAAVTGQPTVPAYQPGTGFVTIGATTPPPSLLNPSTWSLPMWLLIGGGVFLIVRSMGSRRNPPRLTRRKARLILHHRSVRGHPLTPPQRGMFGAVASGYPLTRLRRNPPTKRRSHHVSNSPVRFHGAFAKQADAERKAARLGGMIKSFTVRGQRRYSVMTAA